VLKPERGIYAKQTYPEDTFSVFAERVSSEPFYKLHFIYKMKASKARKAVSCD
jgi:hypothetical protein